MGFSNLSRQQRRAQERAARKAERRGNIAPAAFAVGASLFAGTASAATFTVTNLNDNGAGSLRQAVLDANASAGSDLVTFQAGLTGTIPLTTGEIPITESVTINGPGEAVITVSGNNASRVFAIENTGSTTPEDVNINNLTLTAGYTTLYGGALAVYGENLTLDHVTVTGSRSATGGGGVYGCGCDGATLTITSASITGNFSEGSGGGIYLAYTDGAVSIAGSTITGNTSMGSNNGGGIAIFASYAPVSITNSTISGNTSSPTLFSFGGGVSIDYAYSTVYLANDTLNANQSGGVGGAFEAIMNSGSSLTMKNLVVTNNVAGIATNAPGYGGGIAVYSNTTIEIADSVITGNTADPNDAAGAPLPGTTAYDRGLGGAIQLSGSNTATIHGTTISGNTASFGGGLYFFAGPTVTLENDTIAQNTASSPAGVSMGGGVTVGVGAQATFNETTIVGNSANDEGGGVSVAGDATFYNSIVANNSVTTGTTPDIQSGNGTTTATYTLIEDPGTATIGGGTGNITGSDPNLGPLATNSSTVIAGAPGSTQTPQTEMPLCPSPVINAGDPAFAPPPAADQRGKTRVAGGTIDMGAVEVQPSTLQFTTNVQSVNGDAPNTLTVTVSRTGSADGPVAVNYATADGTATAGSDYTTTSGTLTWADGDTANKTFTVPILADAIYDPNETFTINLSAPTCDATLGVNATQTVTINEIVLPTLAIDNVTLSEGNAGTTAFTFTVTLSQQSTQTTTVNYATADGTATVAGADYTSASGVVTFNPGQTTQTVTVNVNGDLANELDENFTVNLSGPSNATIATGTGTGTILNDDAVPTLSIDSVSQAEGDAGGSNMTFTVTLSAASGQTVTVNYATADGSAVAPGDYTAATNTLTFTPGQTTQTIAVNIAGDTMNEANETFAVNLSGPTNATIATGTGTGTITNDDPVPTLSINSVFKEEGNVGGSNATFTVSLSAASGQTVTVNYTTVDGTAVAPGDYTATTNTLTFTPGQTTQTIAVNVNGDFMNEADETFAVNLSAPTNATIATGTGTGTITNDDAVPSLSIDSVSQAEGNAGVTVMTFTVTLSAASGQTVTVNYATANGSATAPSDFAATTNTLTFAPGQTTQTIAVNINGDTANEVDEVFAVNLSAPTNATIATGTGTGTIVNDDAVPALSIDSPSLAEGNSGGSNMTFTVTLSAASGQTVTVNYSTADGSATAPGDYTTTTNTLTFAPGQTSQTIAVNVNGDTTNEPDETFTVTLSAPNNATIATGTGTGTILNDDGAPSLAINSVSQAEGNAGLSNMVFTVTLSPASGQTVTVTYSTADGTAAAPGDYTSTANTLTFTAGQTTQTISVPIVGDTVSEADETFTVTLSAPTNATLLVPTGTGTIVNDDAAPTLSINSVSQPEGNSGGSNMTFTVTLSAASGQTVTVNYATADGSATAPGDYTTTSNTLTFAPGQTTQTIAVNVNGDATNEPDETFTVNLSAPTNATIATGTGTGTIINDDGAPTLSINSVSQSEGNSGLSNMVFTVTLSAASGQPVTASYATADGTANAAADYIATANTLTFTPGQTTQTISVPIVGDTVSEPDETFTVTLSAPANATLLAPAGTGTIVNDDSAPTLSINNVSQAEGNSGLSNMVFTVTLSPASGQTVTVTYATADGTANAPADYTATANTLTFTPGQTTQTISVPIAGDTACEPDETFTVTLSAPTNATLLAPTGTGTIVNDDACTADVGVTMTSSPSGTVTVGQTITYNVVVTNSGPGGGTSVVVTDVIPAGMTLVSATPSQGSCSGTTTVTCSFGVIPSGGTAALSLQLTPTVRAIFDNTVTVAVSPQTDPSAGNNSSTVSIVVVGVAADIPTLGGWGLIFLALTSAFIGFFTLKTKS